MLKLILILFLLLILKLIFTKKEYFSNYWKHLENQIDEYNRIKSDNNDYNLIIVDLKKISKYPSWDWNLNKIQKNNYLLEALNIMPYNQIKDNLLYTNKKFIHSKSKKKVRYNNSLVPVWYIFGDNPKFKKKKFNNKYTSKSRNQLSKPTCIPFVISELYQNSVGVEEDYSPEYMYYWIKYYEKKDSNLTNQEWEKSKRGFDKPTLLWRSLQIMSKVGMKFERDVPYNERKIHYPTQINYNYKFNNKDKIVNGKFMYLYRNTIYNNQKCSDILIKMLQNGPVAIVVALKQKSFTINNLLYSVNNSNNIKIQSVVAESNDNNLDVAHAIILYGYHTKVYFNFNSLEYKGGFIFKNSWGDEWGTNGYSWITFDYVNKYLYEACQYIN